MSIDHRLEEVLPSEIANSQISQNGHIYIRSEYFEDGQRIFFSPLDFALNGPDEGSIVTRKEENGCEHTVKVLAKHYERGHLEPCMVEVLVSSTLNGHILIENEKLWVIVRKTKTTSLKFGLDTSKGMWSASFALVPDFFIQKKVLMNHLSPRNDVTVGFSTVTGIPLAYLILEDKT